MADKNGDRRLICMFVMHLIITIIGFFSLGVRFGNGPSIKSKNNKNCSIKEEKEAERVIQSPYNMLSAKTMSELLLKVPIYAEVFR